MELEAAGLSPEERLDFDFAIQQFWMSFESRSNERALVDEPKDPPRGKVWGLKYQRLSDIFLSYGLEKEQAQDVSSYMTQIKALDSLYDEFDD